jgi:transcriptional regulator with XRE-family HTH domain
VELSFPKVLDERSLLELSFPVSRKMASPLKIAIVRSDKLQYQVAKEIGVHESRMSQLVHGHRAPRRSEKKALARVLRTPEDVLFPPDLEQTA